MQRYFTVTQLNVLIYLRGPHIFAPIKRLTIRLTSERPLVPLDGERYPELANATTRLCGEAAGTTTCRRLRVG